MIDLTTELKSWFNGLEAVKLAKASFSFWSKVETWLQLPLKQRDIVNCHAAALVVHGWGRRTDRFPGEDIELYRARVLSAFQNMQSAGLINGLADILTRFGVPEFLIMEKAPLTDPDVVSIELPQGGITEDQSLLLKIFQEYGRTCRRYSQTVNETIAILLPSAQVEHNQEIETITAQQIFTDSETVTIYMPVELAAHDHQTEIASL